MQNAELIQLLIEEIEDNEKNKHLISQQNLEIASLKREAN